MKFSHHTNGMQNKGFTLIETVVAILILSLTVGALLTLTANGIFSVRYSRNQIVANNLAQEALEYIRNSRDSAREKGISWYAWLDSTLQVRTNGLPYDPAAWPGAPGPALDLTDPTKYRGCFMNGTSGYTQSQGCLVDPYNTNKHIWEKTTTAASCPAGSGCRYTWYFPSTGFYGYSSRNYPSSLTGSLTGSGTPVMTTFVRTINVVPSPTDPNNAVTVTATVEWLNGSTQKTVRQSMVLTNWGQ